MSAHRCALDSADIAFGRYIISATTPVHARGPRRAPHATRPPWSPATRPATRRVYERLGWRMFDAIERVYVNAAARRDLGWAPRYDFAYALERLAAGEEWRSELALAVGAKGYHAETTGVYTVR